MSERKLAMNEFWATLEARTRLMDIAVGNLSAFLRGEPINIVNK